MGRAKVKIVFVSVSSQTVYSSAIQTSQSLQRKRRKTQKGGLIYGCGYFTTSATHIPFVSGNEKHAEAPTPPLHPLSLLFLKERDSNLSLQVVVK